MARVVAALIFVFLAVFPASRAGASDAAAERPAPVVRPEVDLSNEAAVRVLLRRGGYPGAQVGLLEQIEARRRVEFLPEVVGLLGDPVPEVREAAARALTSFGWECVSAPLIKILSSKDSPRLAVESAAGIVGVMGRPEAVEPLLTLLDDAALAPAATKALGAITFQDFTDAFSWRRWWDANKSRPRIEWAITRIVELRQRIEELGEKLVTDRKQAAELNDKLGEAAVRFLDLRADRADPAPLVAALDVPLLKLRRYAASELGKMKAAVAAGRLAEIATGNDAPSLRAECATALGLIAAPESAAPLRALLGDAGESVAAAAATALGRMKADGETAALLTALRSASPALRAASAEALGHVGGAAAVTPLCEMLAGDKDSSVRERAARALGEIGDARAREVVEKALADDSAAVRVYAVEALGLMGAGQSAPLIGAVLERDPVPGVREAAALALGKLGGKDAAALLTRAVGSSDAKLAALAWSALQSTCRRDEAACASSADGLAAAGNLDRAAALREILEGLAVERKDDKALIAVRLRLADDYIALKRWPKAQSALEALTRALPDDAALAAKYARVLTELKRHADALKVYQALAARPGGGAFWPERLALLDALLADKRADDVVKAVDADLAAAPAPPEDVKAKLADLRRRAAELPR